MKKCRMRNRLIRFGLPAIAFIVIAPAIGLPSQAAMAAPQVPMTASPKNTELFAVSAEPGSTSDAWAVGTANVGTENNQFVTVAEHWDGTKWTQPNTPNPAGDGPNLDNELQDVSTVSSTDAWAVGYYDAVGSRKFFPLLLHWNGANWQRTTAPGGIKTGFLSDVSADSATDAWVLGGTVAGTPIALHWDGTDWTSVQMPVHPGGGFPGNGRLNGGGSVSAISPTNAWAVGRYHNSSGGWSSLIDHWDGRSWKQVASPNLGSTTGFSGLSAVSADSATDAWAVGTAETSTTSKDFILHWNGTRWTSVYTTGNFSPYFPVLEGVSAASPTDVWAVGITTGGGKSSQVFTLHWNGTAWTKVPTPVTKLATSEVFGVSAESPTNAWTVGYFALGHGWGPLQLRWNGKTWNQT